MTKILFITGALYETGGVSRVLSVIASQLSKTHVVHIATTENKTLGKTNRYNLSSHIKVHYIDYQIPFIKKVFQRANIKYNLYRYFPIDTFWEWVYLSRKLQTTIVKMVSVFSIDTVCGVHGEYSCLVGCVANLMSCQTLGWQHNSFDAYFNLPGKYYYGRDFLFKKYVSRLDKNIVLTEYDEKKYKDELGIDSLTIYNPCSFVSEKKADCVNHKFIACGGLRRAKGFDMLIKSFSLFSKDNDNWILEIYGEGEDYAQLNALIIECNLQRRVILCGNTDNIKDKMLESSVYLLSSRWEGMPMVVLEALECGLPVITYDIPAIQPLVTNGVEGIVVSKFEVDAFASAMTEVANNEMLRFQMSEDSKRKSSLFTVEKTVSKWEGVLTQGA